MTVPKHRKYWTRCSSHPRRRWPSYYNGTRDLAFTIIVPRVLIDEQRSGPIIQYGHGLMGSQSEVRGGYLGEIANRYGYVLLAVDWTSMSSVDLTSIIFMIINGGSDWNHPRTMSTRIH